jgi:ribonuclease Z
MCIPTCIDNSKTGFRRGIPEYASSMKLEAFLLNQEHQDPVILIPIPQESEIVIFDLGYCFRLKPRDIQRISSIFISHTHVDHFAGFDHILRLSLDMDKTLKIFGPPGIIGNVEGKLAGYTWNLTDRIRLNYLVTEIHPDKLKVKRYEGSTGFDKDSPVAEMVWNPAEPFLIDKNYKVSAAILDHKIPVLAYKIDAPTSFNASPEVMKEMNLSPGKWVGELKRMIEAGLEQDAKITIDGREFDAAALSEKLVARTSGTSIAYVVDTIFNKKTAASLKKLLQGVDTLFSECVYLTIEKELARENYHLTAKQSATIALETGVKTLYPFHFSRRYEGQYHLLFQEAKAIFSGVEKAKKYS